jgi:hypothetical protein
MWCQVRPREAVERRWKTAWRRDRGGRSGKAEEGRRVWRYRTMRMYNIRGSRATMSSIVDGVDMFLGI